MMHAVMESGQAGMNNVTSNSDTHKSRGNNIGEYSRTIMGVVFCALCTVIAVGFTVPIIVYAIDVGEGRDSNDDPMTLSFNTTFNCSPSKVGQ